MQHMVFTSCLSHTHDHSLPLHCRLPHPPILKHRQPPQTEILMSSSATRLVTTMVAKAVEGGKGGF
ncbi:hypothetical protein Hanom_Chr12g01175591 [Helianthus anomalus]